jgi:hypothetical protein
MVTETGQHWEMPQGGPDQHIGNCLKADPAYGKGVVRALG